MKVCDSLHWLTAMRDFEILFDHAERSELLDPVFARYGRLGFPAPPSDRPWIYSNFVQSIDGVVSFLGTDGSGQDISQSAEDRWLMDLLRAHADAVLLGFRTLKLETELCRPRERGPVFRIVDEALHDMRTKLHRGREKNIFVTGSSAFNLDDYAVFDGEKVDPVILTTKTGLERMEGQLASHPHVKVIVAGDGKMVDLPLAMRLLRTELGVKYVVCEGGPTLFGNMLRAGLIDEAFLTVSPYIVGQQVPETQAMPEGEASSLLRPSLLAGPGFTKTDAPYWAWMSCRKAGDHQFHRFRIKRSGEHKAG